MGRSQSQVIVEVVAPVALLPGIALSPWITVWYGWHRRKVLISVRSSLPRTSTRWAHTSLPHLVFLPWLGYSKHPPPGWIALASGNHSPRFLLRLVDSRGLTRQTFYHQPRDLVYMAPVLLASSMVVFDYLCSWGSLKVFCGGWASSGASSTDLRFFSFSDCWVFSWVFGRCFLLVASFFYILL